LTVAYDGTGLSGWQRQANAVTVQQIVEDAIGGLLHEKIILRGAGRTDAGVHARAQRASFFIPHMPIPLTKFPHVVNKWLPKNIALTHAEEVPLSFHPQYDATHKWYRYAIRCGASPCPLTDRYFFHTPRSLQYDEMQKAARHFIGRHVFTAFKASGAAVKNQQPADDTRTVFDCRIERSHDGDSECFYIYISANGFLYHMVRIIAGTLYYVGLGKINADDIPRILAARDRTQAGLTLPPEGLTLMSVAYDVVIPSQIRTYDSTSATPC
jgi:tRNA pseudouridine38-40 synthase